MKAGLDAQMEIFFLFIVIGGQLLYNIVANGKLKEPVLSLDLDLNL